MRKFTRLQTPKVLADAGMGPSANSSRLSRELSMYSSPLRSADQTIIPYLESDEADAQHLISTDAYVANGQRLHQDNIVGSMFMLNSMPAIDVLGLDDTWQTEFQAEVESKFTLAGDSTNCWLDASGKLTFTEMVRLFVGVQVASGEYVATCEWLRDDQRPFKTAVQAVDIARLSTPPGQTADKTIRAGVRRDRYGRALSYFFRQTHPSEWDLRDSYTWKEVQSQKPWGRKQVIHLYDHARPDQTRGIADIVGALKEIRVTKKFRDIVLQNAVLNATYAATIESELPSEAVFASLGGSDNDPSKAMSDYALGYMSMVAEYSGGARNLNIDGLKIPHLLPGTKFKMSPAGAGGPLGTDFERSLLRYVAAALNVSYEQLSHDYSQTTFAGAQAGAGETGKYMTAKKKRGADRFATQVYRLWLEEAINSGEITSMSRAKRNIYDNPLYFDAYSQCSWIGAGRASIDELKAVQAASLRVKFGFSTREIESSRMGYDWRKVFAQLQREKLEAEQRGIILVDGDNSTNAASGAAQAGTADSGEPDNTTVEETANGQ